MSEPTFEQLSALAPEVSRETFSDLRKLAAEVARWNKTINLIGPGTEAEIWSRHILDSAQLMPLAPRAARWLDLGSGGGFPGLVVATILKGREGSHVDLVESNRKKAGFLLAMMGLMALPASVHALRIQDARPFDVEVVTARALAPMHQLLGLSEPWLTAGAVGLFHKGRDYAQEVSESSRIWAFDLLEHRSAVDPAGVILQVANLRRR